MADIKISEMIITPKDAERLLRKNNHNRPISDAHIRLLANEMANGRWKLNGDAIRTNGELLIDGQHRLYACIKSNTPFKTLVIDGLDSSVFDTIDAGRRRNGADTLALCGEKNTRALASSLVFVHEYYTGKIRNRQIYSNTEIEQLLENSYPDIRESVSFGIRFNLGRLVPQSIFIGLHYLFSKSDRQLADKFMESFVKGELISVEDPVYLLRERMLQNKFNKAKLTRVYIAAIFIKAWNATITGKKINFLRWRQDGHASEQFPTIIRVGKIKSDPKVEEKIIGVFNG